MKNIELAHLSKYEDSSMYENISNGIYQNLISKEYEMAISFKLEENEELFMPEDGEFEEGVQSFPFEMLLNVSNLECIDILQKGEDYCAELKSTNRDKKKGLLSLEKFKDVLGKKVYEKEIEEGVFDLVIE